MLHRLLPYKLRSWITTATKLPTVASNIKWYQHPRFSRPVSIAPLVSFRILFGLMMLLSIIRFWYRGWITSVYIKPAFHFTYTGFDWVQPLGAVGMHVIFAAVALAALCIAIGWLYRVASIVFFVGFSYIELIDVTTYLNHYYFISLVAFLLIWLPANRSYAVDALIQPHKARKMVPLWCIGIIRFQMAVVYVCAGIAKINPSWLLDAEPLRTWLPATTHLPIVGGFMYQAWVAYLFSWFGAIYDLFIAFFLLNHRTRPIAYVFVLLFHIATAIFFPGIGLFPYVMILGSTVFFSGSFHEKVLSRLPRYPITPPTLPTEGSTYRYTYPRWCALAIGLYVLVQVLVPFRHLLYPGRLFWTEQGYRFSWRVMLMEKSGAAYFTVRDKSNNRTFAVNNAEFLTPIQEKMMSTQPDLLVKYAHLLKQVYLRRGLKDPGVYAEVYVSLNGSRSRLFVDTATDLAAEPINLKHKKWVLPFKEQ